MEIIHSVSAVVCNSISILYLFVCGVDLLLRLTPLSQRLTPPSSQAHFDTIVRNIAVPSRLATVSRFLQLLQISVAWPVLIRQQLLLPKRANNLEFAARVQLRPVEINIAAFNIAVLTFAAVMGALNLVWHRLLLLIVLAVLAAVVARHVSYLLGSLPERFRRSGYNPYGSYTILAACDALSLLLSISLLRSPGHQFHVTWPIVKSSALDLFTLRQIPEIASESYGVALASLIGLLFYSAMLKTIFNLEQFKRTDEDLRALATTSVLTGDFAQARKWLSEERQRTAESFNARAVIELGSGNFPEAADQIRNSLRLAGGNDDQESVGLAMLSLVFGIPMSLQHRVSYIKYIMIINSSDLLALQAIETVSIMLRTPDELALERSGEREEFVSQLLGACPEEDYPLARARLMAIRGDFGEATGILERARPGSEVEEIVRLTYACTFECANPDVSMDDTNSYVARWLQESLPLIKGMLKEVTTGYRPAVVSSFVFLSVLLDDLDVPGGEAVLNLATQITDSEDQIQRMSRIWHNVLVE
jgi:hypothetical protein